jgi:hypothetical protein
MASLRSGKVLPSPAEADKARRIGRIDRALELIHKKLPMLEKKQFEKGGELAAYELPAPKNFAEPLPESTQKVTGFTTVGGIGYLTFRTKSGTQRGN